MNELFNIKDQVVVITGGTGVLGKTIAKYLALNGAKVVILGRKEEVGNAEGQVATLVLGYGGNRHEPQQECRQDVLFAFYHRVVNYLASC